MGFARQTDRRLGENERAEVIGEAVGQAVAKIQNFMESSGFNETAALIREHFDKKGQSPSFTILNKPRRGAVTKTVKTGGRANTQMSFIPSESEVTIYRNVLIDETDLNKSRDRNSSSSDELVNTSDETVENNTTSPEVIVEKFIAENRPQAQAMEDVAAEQNLVEAPQEVAVAGPSRVAVRDKEKETGDRVDFLIREAEGTRTKIFQTPGEFIGEKEGVGEAVIPVKNFTHSAMVDEDYLVLAGHLDEGLRNKIEKGEYVDLAKLLPKDRVAQEDDQHLQMVVRK